MKKRLHFATFTCFIFSLILLQSKSLFSQALMFGNEKTRVEVGINVGPSFFLGDLGGNRGKGTRFVKDVNLSMTKIMKGAYATVYPNEWLGLRAAFQMGVLEGDDRLIKNNGSHELFRKQRNLDFRSNITELYVAAELYPIMLLYNGNADYKPRLRPYGVIGVGAFKFNPQGSLTDNSGKVTWHDLKPLHTEGQGFDEFPDRKEYSLTQINIPMGLGVKYMVSERINVSFELLLRKSFTDYIDDVSTNYIDPNLFVKYLPAADAVTARRISDKVFAIVNPNLSRNAPGIQRGNPSQNDSYFTTFVKFGIRLGPVFENTYARNAANMMRCPTRF